MLPASLLDIESETMIKIAIATAYMGSRCRDLCTSYVNIGSVDLVICYQLYYPTLKVRHDINLLLPKKLSLWLFLGTELAINMSWLS